eukprot:7389249-Prymnesium_polylepis.3
MSRCCVQSHIPKAPHVPRARRLRRWGGNPEWCALMRYARRREGVLSNRSNIVVRRLLRSALSACRIRRARCPQSV